MPLVSRFHGQRGPSRPKRRYLVAYHCLMRQNLRRALRDRRRNPRFELAREAENFFQGSILRQGQAHQGGVHGHSQQRSQVSNDGEHPRQRYIARDEGQEAASSARLQVSLASAKSSRQTRCRTPSSQCLHLRSWLLLAQASGLQIRHDPKDPRGFLADEIRSEREA